MIKEKQHPTIYAAFASVDSSVAVAVSIMNQSRFVANCSYTIA